MVEVQQFILSAFGWIALLSGAVVIAGGIVIALIDAMQSAFAPDD